MSEEAAKAGWLTPIRVGLGLTAIVLAAFAAMALQERCVLLVSGVLECRENYQWFLDSSPNEVGDTLAGFAGALAFIWIVVTVWLQSSELAEQREVLREQKEEFKLMVAAQTAQVAALQAQADIFADEKRRRDQEESKGLYEQYLIDVCRVIQALSDQRLTWYFPDSRDTTYDQYGETHRILSLSGHRFESEVNVNDYLRYLRASLPKLREKLAKGEEVRLPHRTPFLPLLVEKLERMILLQEKLASPEVERLKRTTAKILAEVLREIESDNALWAPSSRDTG